MSGGAFDYAQYRIADIYTEIEDEIYGHHLDDEFDVNRYIKDHWLEDSEKEYVRKHHHTIPNRSEYSKETIKEFKKGIALLKKAEVYEQRIDWLLSGDDGEDSKKIVLYQQRTVGASHRWFKGCKRPYPQGGGFKPVYTSRKIVFNAFGHK